MSRRTVLAALFARATLAARPGLVRPAEDDAELIRLLTPCQQHQTSLSAWDHNVSISDEQIHCSVSGGKFCTERPNFGPSLSKGYGQKPRCSSR